MRCLVALCAAGAFNLRSVAIVIAKPSYQDSVDCANKVSSLADESNRLLSEHQQIDNSCARSIRYYTDMIASVEKTIAHYEGQVDAQDSDEELSKVYRKRYTGMMCTKSYEAFFLKDEDARLEVLHICTGRESLAPSSFLLHASQFDQTNCPQAKSMQDRVDMLRAEKATKAAECMSKKRALKNTLDEKRAKEDELEEKYYGHHTNKGEIRSKAGAEVEAKFCGVIMPNYKLNEDKIKQFWTQNCPA